jgi:hypothetical protein
MSTNNFIEFNVNKTNMESDAEYTADTQRAGGVLPGIANSRMHNKLFRQTSVMTAAFAAAIQSKGIDVSDADLTTLIAAVTAAFITPLAVHQADMSHKAAKIYAYKNLGGGL